MLQNSSKGSFRPASTRRLVWFLLSGLILMIPVGQAAEAQRIRFDAGGGWAFPIDNVEAETSVEAEIPRQGGGTEITTVSVPQEIDLEGGPHVYAGVGVVRSIGDKVDLGARLRGHVSQIRSTVECRFQSTCGEPDGTLLLGTFEGRLIITSPDWIHPYVLVGLGVSYLTVDEVTLRNIEDPRIRQETIAFPDVSVLDAGGDVGIGASIPVSGGLYLDAEVRATGSLPGGKENAVTAIPLTLGVSYGFE